MHGMQRLSAGLLFFFLASRPSRLVSVTYLVSRPVGRSVQRSACPSRHLPPNLYNQSAVNQCCGLPMMNNVKKKKKKKKTARRLISNQPCCLLACLLAFIHVACPVRSSSHLPSRVRCPRDHNHANGVRAGVPPREREREREREQESKQASAPARRVSLWPQSRFARFCHFALPRSSTGKFSILSGPREGGDETRSVDGGWRR
ncbi:hypothetical protein JOL62DRAFT_309471 [Phyllosticta paracitricarpa]|uniref:Secreted protein n=1 Tax=Phyllosticta paracitricarpa TaxID=2016321 RepID=A0ABR1MVK4_9PEZI